MAKKQAAAVLPFVLVDSVTSTGKPCIFWDKRQSQNMVREDFLSLRHEIGLLGTPEKPGFMYSSKGNPTFMNVPKADLISLLRGKTWVENTPKEPAKQAPAKVKQAPKESKKQGKQAPAMDAETAKMFAMFQAFMKASGK